VLLACVAVSSLVYSQRSKRNAKEPSHSSRDSNGGQVFAANCAGCHGLDGMGGARAPNIVTSGQVQKLSAKEIRHIVSAGIPGTGMPGFRRLGESAINAAVVYVTYLQRKSRPRPLRGNPNRGAAIFFGSGQCSNCHMAAGRGGFIAADLSAYGQTHTAEEMTTAIMNPGKRDSAKNMADVMTVTGEHYQGLIRNEDNFSLQLQSIDGEFHFFSKTDLKAVERSRESIMPSDYASRLTQSEVKDLVSYLLSIGRTSVPGDSHNDDDE